MEAITFSPEDRILLMDLTAELRRYNDIEESKRDTLLSCREAATRLGVTPQTVSVMVRDGRLRKVMRGGRLGILESELSKLNY